MIDTLHVSVYDQAEDERVKMEISGVDSVKDCFLACVTIAMGSIVWLFKKGR